MHYLSLITAQQEFHELTIAGDSDEQVEALIIGDLGEAWNFNTLNRAFRLLMQYPPPHLVALGMTRYWKAEDGLRLDVALFVKALQHASDIIPIVMGKPAKLFYQSALDILQITADETVMIGDNIRSDIAGAQAAGLHAIQV